MCPDKDVEPATALKLARAEIKDLQRELAVRKEISANQKIADASAEIEHLQEKLEKLAEIGKEVAEAWEELKKSD
ncbi:hypothetical protein L3Y34_019306 [Caenorhabditis briggsae]|uniref:Uncharacterized protein n=1 Tax=Caenorhabditis briggsae TaxID=6238 RepID=A0AAE9DQI4_CAEBR|nr:hypothetical protein L3Y34_019306 [Caenorhabditis briggsae]